ncbi:hypothetical protein FRC01_003888 [Tulasnella sp. 417]|nr:hypothetical protein FRC01_003888 [Tulasnella sp. 417]
MANIFLPHQSQPQPNREYVFDDPLAPLRLAPLAQISEFWRRYDRLADIHDKKLTTNLNGNLDVLLIFAALFSAINTTFISITMPDLSPNPSDETNTLLRLLIMRADNNTLTPSDLALPFAVKSSSITVNCLLYASLSCSLLAAVGAMMAKEWLQSFDRTGQTGPLEEQARFRQRKFNGVQEWHLEAVIKFLPNLLLLSVIFFFIGICLFLFPINTVVAGIVIAFSGIGAVFSGIVIVAGAASLTCPYQSAASNALRRGCRGLVQPCRLVWRALIHPAVSRASEELREVRTNILPWFHFLRAKTSSAVLRVQSWYRRSSGSDHSAGQEVIDQAPARLPHFVTYLYSAIRGYFPTWLPVNSENDQAENQNSSDEAERRPGVGGFSEPIARVKRLWARLPKMSSLLTLHRDPAALPTEANSDQVLTIQAARWLLETTSNRGDQISTAQFICSLDKATCANVFEEHDSWQRLLELTLSALEIWYSQPNKENQEVAELFGLVLCRVLLQCPKEDAKWKNITEDSLQGSNDFGKTFLQTLALASSKHSPAEPEDDQRILHTSLIFTALDKRLNLKEFQWANTSRLLDNHAPAAAALLSVWALLVWGVGVAQSGRTVGMYFDFTGFLEDKRELAGNLVGALSQSPECFQLVQGDLGSELNAAQGYTVCIQKARELSATFSSLEWAGLDGIGQLIWSYINHLTTSGSTDLRMVRLSVKTLLTLGAFLATRPDGSAKHSTSSDNLISSGDLIDTVVDVLLNDLTSLTSRNEKWKSRGRTFKACVIRILVWIWRNHPDRDPDAWTRGSFFTSSCRLWAPLEKEVKFSKTGSFRDEDRPLTPDDLKGVAEFAQWVQTQTLSIYYYTEDGKLKSIETSAFIVSGADVGINRLYAHFDRRGEWDYHLYEFHEEVESCSRSAYMEDGML